MGGLDGWDRHILSWTKYVVETAILIDALDHYRMSQW